MSTSTCPASPGCTAVTSVFQVEGLARRSRAPSCGTPSKQAWRLDVGGVLGRLRRRPLRQRKSRLIFSSTMIVDNGVTSAASE
jgi:hypothetical protein